MKKAINLTLDDETRTMLDILAEAAGQSRSAYLTALIRQEYKAPREEEIAYWRDSAAAAWHAVQQSPAAQLVALSRSTPSVADLTDA